MNITIYDSGINKFIDICKKEKISKTDIDKLLSDVSYASAISFMGENWGIGNYNDWKAIFMAALVHNATNTSDKNKAYINHIQSAKTQVHCLSEMCFRLQNIIKSNYFLEIVSRYANINKLQNISFHLLLFGPNAGGNENIYLDLLFLAPFTDEEIASIIAHELHHIIRNEQEMYYSSNYDTIYQMLFWLESEGCANLCNYDTTYKLYEMHGYAKKDRMQYNLKHIKDHIDTISNLIIKIYKNEFEQNELYNYLITDVLFHTLGYYMAKTINDYSNDLLKETIGDSLQFLNAYQTICNNENVGYPFMDESIKIINNVVFATQGDYK